MGNRFVTLAGVLACLAAIATSPTPTSGEEKPELVIVRLCEGDPPKSLDPHKTGDVISSRQAGMAYECLLQYDVFASPPKLVPCLAAEMPRHDAEKLTYTFKLRDDAFFADDRCFHADAKGKTFEREGDSMQEKRGAGRKLTAADMVYSLKRLAALPDSEGYWTLEGSIAGLDDFHLKLVELKGKNKGEANPDREWREAMKADVAGLRAVDDRTFAVKLTRKYPQFLCALTLPYGAALAQEAVEYYGDDFVQHPVGTGPFTLKPRKPDGDLIWLRNERYRNDLMPSSDVPGDAAYKPLAGKRLPLADRVEYRIIRESDPALEAFLMGEIDASGISKDQVPVLMDPGFKLKPGLELIGITAFTWSDPTVTYLCFNMNDPVVGGQKSKGDGKKQLAIRRAIALCFDREKYIQDFRNGRGTSATQMVPPGVIGHDPGYSMASQKHDPAAGRKALTDAGFEVTETKDGKWKAVDPATGKQVQVTIQLRSNLSGAEDFAAFLKTCGETVGIELSGELNRFAEFLRKQNEGEGPAYDAGWVMDYPDAQNLYQLLASDDGTGINTSRYSSHDYDALYAELRELDDGLPAQRKRKLELIGQINQLIDKDVPWVFLTYGKVVALRNSWYVAPQPNAFAYSFGKYLWSDGQAREKTIALRK